MSGDYRKGSKDELSFYVFDNLRFTQDQMHPNIYRYDTLEEAMAKYQELPKEWTSAIGGSIHDTKELDFIHRRQGRDILVTDYRKLDFWSRDEKVKSAIDTLTSSLHVRYESSRDLLDGRSILIPLEEGERTLSSYYNQKLLDPKHKEHLTSAINEAYVMGHGWVPFQELIKMSVDYGYHNPNCPLVTHFNVNYCTMDGNRGQADIKPCEFRLLKEKTARAYEKEEEKESDMMLWARVGMSINVTEKEYEKLLEGDAKLLRDVLFGKTGKAFLSGETYFPEIDENRELGEMEYYFTEEEIFLKPAPSKERGALDEMIKKASDKKQEEVDGAIRQEPER